MRCLLIIPLLLILSCNVQKRDNFSYIDPDSKSLWKNSFKYEVFYGCIKEGIGNDSLRIVLKNKDLFNTNFDVDFIITDKARDLGKKVIKNMPKAFIKIDIGEEDLEDNNFISYNCLKYYASKELDSIAEAEYKKLKK